MSELIPPDENNFARFSDDDLLKELSRGLTLTAQVLTRLGAIWAELQRRGRNLSHLRHGLTRNVPLIASGLLAAEAVVAFAGRQSILNAIEGLPLEEQRRLAAGGGVEVATMASSNKTELVPITSIPAGRLRVVFSDGMLLSPAEQRVRLGRKKRVDKHTEEDDTARRYRPRYDPQSGTVQVGRMTIQLADLLHELASASGPDNPPVEDNEYVVVKTRLKPDEVRRFLAVVNKSGLPDWELIRKAMRAFGLI